jgi:UDP-glucose 4-epimerase
MKKILITGGAGYIGSHIAEELLKKNDIIIIDNLSTGYKKFIFKKSKFYNLDIRDILKVKKIINSEKIDIIIHLAAKLSLQEAQKNPKKYIDNNVQGTKNLLEAIKGSKVKCIIFSSTAAVYSGNKVIGCSEILKTKPSNLYGKTKILGEKAIKVFCKKNNIKSIILRYFNVVGASKSGKIGPLKNYGQLFKRLSKIVFKKNSIISIYGNNHNTKDGTCKRDFIDINDIVDIHKIILKKLNKIRSGEIINCGYGKGLSVFKTIQNFQKVSKKNIKIKILKKRANEISDIYAKNFKIKKILGWVPKYQNIFLTIERCLKWEKKNTNAKK